MQQVGGLMNAGQQLGERPADRLDGGVAAAQERQRRLAAERPRRIAEDFIGTGRRQCLLERRLLEPTDVVDAADRKRRGEGLAARAHGMSVVSVAWSWRPLLQPCPNA